MSAVEEYREKKVYLAEVCGAGTLEDLADAALAEMEAKNEALRGSLETSIGLRAHLVACYYAMEEAKRLVSIERDAALRADRASWERAELAEAEVASLQWKLGEKGLV